MKKTAEGSRMVHAFVILRNEARDPERPIIDTADCEINGKRDGVRAITIPYSR